MMSDHPRAMLTAALLLVATFTVGCFGAFFEHIRIDPSSAEQLRAQVPVYRSDQLRPSEYRVIQSLNATSCKLKIWDSSPSAEDATDQLRVKASRVGANGLVNVSCEAPSGTSLVKNCWSSLTCHGAAIVLGPATAPSASDVEEKLRLIQDLRRRGLISDEEAAQRRRELLDRVTR